MSEVKKIVLGRFTLFFYDPREFDFDWLPYSLGETRIKGKLQDASWAWGYWAIEVRYD